MKNAETSDKNFHRTSPATEVAIWAMRRAKRSDETSYVCRVCVMCVFIFLAV